MTFATVCSGIGAPECAWQALAWRCAFAAEIDRFSSAVYAQHFPNTPNLGDITKFKDWPDYAIDLLAGGTPCQSFSVAGLRKGLSDPRGNLMLTFLAIARRYAPTWLLWENVPGVLSVDGGRAFGTLLGGLAELGYGFAYRILDAQFFGVPQRRRRVFVVAHSGGQWQRAAAVLFERQSLCGHPAPRREEGEKVAGPIAGCSNGGGANGPGRTADDADSCIPIQEIGKRQSGTPENGVGYGDPDDPMFTLQSSAVHGIAQASAVRRLTPTECERLQGFPDGWTNILYRSKTASDGPRYKALGNSMAVPVLRWIAHRLEIVSVL